MPHYSTVKNGSRGGCLGFLLTGGMWGCLALRISPFQDVGDALAGVAVAVGIGGMGHLGVFFGVVQELCEPFVDGFLAGAHQLQGAGR